MTRIVRKQRAKRTRSEPKTRNSVDARRAAPALSLIRASWMRVGRPNGQRREWLLIQSGESSATRELPRFIDESCARFTVEYSRWLLQPEILRLWKECKRETDSQERELRLRDLRKMESESFSSREDPPRDVRESSLCSDRDLEDVSNLKKYANYKMRLSSALQKTRTDGLPRAIPTYASRIAPFTRNDVFPLEKMVLVWGEV